MFSVDLLVWLLIVALVTAGWSLATPRHKGSQVLVRRERLHDITPVFHFSDRDVAVATGSINRLAESENRHQP